MTEITTSIGSDDAETGVDDTTAATDTTDAASDATDGVAAVTDDVVEASAQPVDDGAAFLAELARAMQATASEERTRAAAEIDRRREQHLAGIDARRAAEVERMRKLADGDLQAIDAWAEGERQRIERERETRAAALRADLETSLTKHTPHETGRGAGATKTVSPDRAMAADVEVCDVLPSQWNDEVPKPAPVDIDQPASVLILLRGHAVKNCSAARELGAQLGGIGRIDPTVLLLCPNCKSEKLRLIQVAEFHSCVVPVLPERRAASDLDGFEIPCADVSSLEISFFAVSNPWSCDSAAGKPSNSRARSSARSM